MKVEHFLKILEEMGVRYRVSSTTGALHVIGSLDLRHTQITSLPEGLSVGGSVLLYSCPLTRNAPTAGFSERPIYVWKHISKGLVISLGCFTGTESEALEAVGRKYGDGSDYSRKIQEAFKIARERKQAPH